MKDKPGIPLYLFAKAPLPGQVKTRMSPGLTPQQCADLAVMMLEQSMAKVANSWPGRKVLAVTPDPDHPVFRKLVSVHGFETRIQADGDLGHRMWDMLTSGIKSAGAAVVMGCDVPQIPEDLLFRAHEDVLSGLNVIGPARDGGFYLLGIGKDSPAPFDQINWGTEEVMAKVMENALNCGLDLVQYPMLRDIDQREDLEWLAREDPAYAVFTG
jgi:rSAM/selenodomain-associated transferase 1